MDQNNITEIELKRFKQKQIVEEQGDYKGIYSPASEYYKMEQNFNLIVNKILQLQNIENALKTGPIIATELNLNPIQKEQGELLISVVKTKKELLDGLKSIVSFYKEKWGEYEKNDAHKIDVEEHLKNIEANKKILALFLDTEETLQIKFL